MKDKNLAMLPLFPRDFITATLGWTPEQRGVYITLLCAQWEQGALPPDEATLANIVGVALPDFARAWSKVEPKFVDRGDGQLVNMRLEEHRTKSLNLKSVRSIAGKLGGKAKAKAKANGLPKYQTKSYPPSPSPSPSPTPSPAVTESVAKAPPAARGTRLPKDFALTEERRAYAIKHGLEPNLVYGMFTTYWWAKAGSGGVKLDWDATWQHWCMKDAEKNAPKPNFMNTPAKAAPTVAELMARGRNE